MAKSRKKVRIAYGIHAESEDGMIWTWTHDSVRYRWCLLGHIEIVGEQYISRIGYSRKLLEAMAYISGLANGIRQGRHAKAESWASPYPAPGETHLTYPVIPPTGEDVSQR